MDGTIQEYVLDMAADTKKEPLRVKQYDTNSRQARITLKMGSEPWTIPFGCQIHINVRKTDGTLADATCTRIDEHTVLTPITEQMTAVTGTQLGELYFLGSDGDIKSQSFPVVVYEAVMDQARMESSDDFQSLQGALRQVETSTEMADAATQYATAQGDRAGAAAQRAEDAADSIQAAVDAAANAKACESNAKNSELAAAQTQQEVTDYVESQKAAFVGYSKRESDSQYANALTNSVTGEGGVTVEDAWTAPVLGLDVVGKSEQATTTGAQLLPQPQFNDTKNGITVKTQMDGGISITGTATSAIAFTVAEILLPAGTYILSGLSGLVVGRMYFQLVEISAQGGQFVGELAKVGPVASATVTIDRDVWARAEIKVLSGVTADSICYPMLNFGDTALPWEPYTGGAPSPSPDYPQDIISVGTVSTGAQLFYKSLVTLQGTGAEADIIDKRAIKITYARANGGKYAGFIVDDKINIIGKTLTVSYSGIVSSKSGLTPGIRLYWIDNNGSVLSYVVYVNKSPTTITIEDPQNDAATKLALLLYADVGDVAVVNDYVIYKDIMINAEDTALPWEPYTGGKPSPSVEYPQTLEVTATGRNLYDPTKTATATHNGTINKIENDEIYFTASGADSFFGDATTKGGRYQPQFGDMQTIKGARIRVIVTNKWFDKNYITFWDTSGVSLGYTATLDVTVEVPKDAVAYTIRCGHTEQSTETQSTKIQVQYDSENVDYEPYRSASAPITLTEPLRGIGDYRDRIMCRDGEWGVERWCQADIFDGSADEAWIMYSQEIRDRYYIIIKNAVHTETSSVLCDKAIGKLSGKGNAYTELNTIWLQSTPEYRRLYLNFAADDVEKLHEELQMNPLTVIYPLDTPTWEPFDDATQQALNELTTYSGTTHLTITAGGTAPTVTLDYVKDTHKALEQCQEAAKEYTDNQIATIVAALPTATQAAIVDTQTSTLLKEVERL